MQEDLGGGKGAGNLRGSGAGGSQRCCRFGRGRRRRLGLSRILCQLQDGSLSIIYLLSSYSSLKGMLWETPTRAARYLRGQSPFHAMSVCLDGGPRKRTSSRKLTPILVSALHRHASKLQDSSLRSYKSAHERAGAFLTEEPSAPVDVVTDQSSCDGFGERTRR
jgi:hypothetical protein